jgi:hypothetical protein
VPRRLTPPVVPLALKTRKAPKRHPTCGTFAERKLKISADPTPASALRKTMRRTWNHYSDCEFCLDREEYRKPHACSSLSCVADFLCAL